jgi:superfamily II DNA helicase RecQ
MRFTTNPFKVFRAPQINDKNVACSISTIAYCLQMTFQSSDKLGSLLKETFGYSSFKPGQLEIIEAILAKKNVLAVMPTAAGKSLCYQLPAIHSSKKTIVISPLVALMDDQTASLSELGVQVSKIHSGLSREEY